MTYNRKETCTKRQKDIDRKVYNKGNFLKREVSGVVALFRLHHDEISCELLVV
jgi:hypothetical protein